jgi:hypothetical protein
MKSKELVLRKGIKNENELKQISTQIKNPSGALWDDEVLNQIWIEVDSSSRNPILLGIEETKKLLAHISIINDYFPISLSKYAEIESIRYLWGMPVNALYQNKQFCGIKVEENERYYDWKGNLEFELADASIRPKRKFNNILDYIRSRGE